MKTVEEYSSIINNAILGVHFQPPYSLSDPIVYTMRGNGKRLRPVLTLAVAEALGVSPHRVLGPAVAVEVYHNFTLLHDDVMDNSPMRRGQPSVWKKWNTAQAILSGDAMLSVALDCLLHVCLPNEVIVELVRCFNGIALDVDAGQQFDMDFEKRYDVTLEEYIKMISLKTGALLGGACLIGAICGGAPARVRTAFYDYGKYLGIAFQIQDDILDVFGDEATLGKPIGGDILNDKHTWLYISAKYAAPETMADLYRQHLSGAEKITAIRSVYEQYGLQEKAEREVARYLQIAVDAIATTGLDENTQSFFTDFAHSLIGRKK